MTYLFRQPTVIRSAAPLGIALLILWGCNRSSQPDTSESPASAPQRDSAASERNRQDSIASIEPAAPFETLDSVGSRDGSVPASESRPNTISSDRITPSVGAGASPDRTSPDRTSPGPNNPGQSPQTSVPPAAMSAETQSSDPDVLREQALEALDSGDTETALRRMRRLQTIATLDHESTFLMARVLAERNRFAEAIWMLDELAEAVPDLALPVTGQTAEWMVLNGQWQEAEQRYRTLLDAADGPLAMMVNRMLAQLLLRQGRREEAARLLSEMCRFGDVNEGELRALLSVAFPLANESIDEAELEPIGALGRARYEISQENWQAAAEALKGASEGHHGAVALLGRIHAHQQDFEALEAWAADVPEAERTFADYWFALAVLQSHQGQHLDAVKSCCQVVLADPTDHQAYQLLGDALDALGQSDNAKQAHDRADKIQRTQRIGNAMAASQRPRQDEMDELKQLLEELKRPFESFAWNAIEIIYKQSTGELKQNAVMQALSQINGRRMQQLQASPSGATREFILCGIDPDTL